MKHNEMISLQKNVAKLIENKNVFYKKHISVLYKELKEIRKEDKRDFCLEIKSLSDELKKIFEEKNKN